jgi:hypothetical protein
MSQKSGTRQSKLRMFRFFAKSSTPLRCFSFFVKRGCAPFHDAPFQGKKLILFLAYFNFEGISLKLPFSIKITFSSNV